MAFEIPPISSVLPPLILGTATFNTQYVDDPSRMPYVEIVSRAVDLGINAFDTSPYYGPSEELLGNALRSLSGPSHSADGTKKPLARSDYFLITKVGRVASREFDYSPAWIRRSVDRSLARLGTAQLDLVYAHDVEFVSPAAVVSAVATLRAMRAEGKLRYVGISGFPLATLCSLADRVRAETGEAVDAVMSYGHCTVQNETLPAKETLSRLCRAGVGVVLNASILNMGLLTTRGVDNGPQAAWHPSPSGLRDACSCVAKACQEAGEKLEAVALRYSLDEWARMGGAAGLGTDALTRSERRPSPKTLGFKADSSSTGIGASVIGVTSVEELEETVREWRSVLDGLGVLPNGTEDSAGIGGNKQITSLRRQKEVKRFVREKLWPILGEWKNFAWPSPPKGWVNQGGRL